MLLYWCDYISFFGCSWVTFFTWVRHWVSTLLRYEYVFCHVCCQDQTCLITLRRTCSCPRMKTPPALMGCHAERFSPDPLFTPSWYASHSPSRVVHVTHTWCHLPSLSERGRVTAYTHQHTHIWKTHTQTKMVIFSAHSWPYVLLLCESQRFFHFLALPSCLRLYLSSAENTHTHIHTNINMRK